MGVGMGDVCGCFWALKDVGTGVKVGDGTEGGKGGGRAEGGGDAWGKA